MIKLDCISFYFRWFTNHSIILFFWGALFLFGYSITVYGADADINLDRPNVELDLFDSMAFDIKLSRSLAAKQATVTVRSVAPFTVNDIPDRIDKWITSVSKYGGKVDLKPDPNYPPSRDLGGVIVELLIKVYDLTKEMLMYRYAENYNVDILFKPGSGEVTRFVFTRKEVME